METADEMFAALKAKRIENRFKDERIIYRYDMEAPHLIALGVYNDMLVEEIWIGPKSEKAEPVRVFASTGKFYSKRPFKFEEILAVAKLIEEMKSETGK